MTRHHGDFASCCRFCGLFVSSKCEKYKFELKKFEKTEEEYANIEIARFKDKKNGKEILILPGYNYVSHNTTCGVFENWLERTIDNNIEWGIWENKEVKRCDSFQRFQYI